MKKLIATIVFVGFASIMSFAQTATENETKTAKIEMSTSSASDENVAGETVSPKPEMSTQAPEQPKTPEKVCTKKSSCCKKSAATKE